MGWHYVSMPVTWALGDMPRYYRIQIRYHRMCVVSRLCCTISEHLSLNTFQIYSQMCPMKENISQAPIIVKSWDILPLNFEATSYMFTLISSLSWNETGASAGLLPRRLSNFKVTRSCPRPISQHRDFPKPYDKTSYSLATRVPVFWTLH